LIENGGVAHNFESGPPNYPIFFTTIYRSSLNLVIIDVMVGDLSPLNN
jgi:hypothetical protein